MFSVAFKHVLVNQMILVKILNHLFNRVVKFWSKAKSIDTKEYQMICFEVLFMFSLNHIFVALIQLNLVLIAISFH